jgi:hypothetical protein
MGCLLALLAGFAPRVALALVWIAEFVWFAMPGVGRRGQPPRSPRLAAAHTRLASITATQTQLMPWVGGNGERSQVLPSFLEDLDLG